ncbi:MAG: hypothetical protein HYY37_01905 [Candidatus Aenigmarchaeota archaeon]|nr:hypothetical protein [Candidatus Aenigmarchaeota archaeon]
METVVDNFFSRKILLETKDIYGAALELVFVLDSFGKSQFTQNTFETDGPRKKSKVAAALVKRFDKHSSLAMSVKITGESNGIGYIEVMINADFQMVFPLEEGIVYNTFMNYYAGSISHVFREMAEQRAKEIYDALEQKAKELRQRQPMS